MHKRTITIRHLCSAICATLALLFAVSGAMTRATAAPSAQEQARAILDATGVKGGLIVHLGCGDGELTAALRASESYVVHGLDADARNVETARGKLQAAGLYGPVTVARFDGRQLPYIDNMVNLLTGELGGVPLAEVTRVLAPDGVTYLQRGGKWTKTVKPRPAEIDEWTHYLHDPQGTMVGKDQVVGLPRRMQWVGDPKWLRNHDFMSSLSGMVSSGGRIFYIIDEGLRQHIYLPARWVVVARDAFNGAVLWKRPIEFWFPHTWPFKSGPGDLPRRIVADGDRVYVTLGLTAPLSVLDAATGEIIRTYEGTKGTEEIVLDDGTLFLLVDPAKKLFEYKHASPSRGAEQKRVNAEFGWSLEQPPRTVLAVSAKSGKVLWERKDKVAPLTLAVQGQKVFFYDGERVAALNRKDGQQAWRSEPVSAPLMPATGYAPRLIVGDGVVLLSSNKGHGGRLVGVDVGTGAIRWKSEQPKSGHFSPEDVFLIQGAVWSADTGKGQVKGTHFVGVDAKTGAVKQDFVAKQIEAFFMHQRCYPGRATERFIMASGTGTEFLEMGTENCEIHHWLRGSCIYGIMPANGLLYKPPDSCACFYQSKLHHFCALAPKRISNSELRITKNERLEKGSAFGKIPHLQSPIPNPNDWPNYRRDNARSGASKTSIPEKLKEAWKAKIGGKLSALTAAEGKLFVSAIDRHTVYALDADSGKEAWSFIAGGRVDSPPTIAGGLALFGCADGWVYCLNAADGKLAWRFRAAPGDDKLLSYQQVESVWPLHGSVLVRDGVAYCLAGRTMFLDGGMRLVRLDCATGKLLSETVLDDKDPETGKNLQTLIAGKAMPVSNADLLSFDGTHIYLKSQKFDLRGKRIDLKVAIGKEAEQAGEGRHLFCPTGFLDEVWFHRTYWMYGKNAGEGHGEYTVPRNRTPVGRLMVFDDANVYACMAQNVGNNINPRTSYNLYAARKEAAPTAPPRGAEGAKGAKGARDKTKKKVKPATGGKGVPHLWELQKPGLLANGMVLAGGKLFLAGAPDVADEEKTFDFVYHAKDEIHADFEKQEAAWRGKQGALLWVVSADKGQPLAEYKIDAIPVWDGMIAAHGKLYLALQDGTVRCMSGK